MDIICSGAQGSHEPVWITSNTLLRDDLGLVSMNEPNNNQVVDSDYTSRYPLKLVIYTVTAVDAVYVDYTHMQVKAL